MLKNGRIKAESEMETKNANVYREDAPNTVHTTKDEVDHKKAVYQCQWWS